jgi:hypothetical protein
MFCISLLLTSSSQAKLHRKRDLWKEVDEPANFALDREGSTKPLSSGSSSSNSGTDTVLDNSFSVKRGSFIAKWRRRYEGALLGGDATNTHY